MGALLSSSDGWPECVYNICKSDHLLQMPRELYTYSIGVTSYKWSVSVMVLVVIIYLIQTLGSILAECIFL